MPVVLRHRNGGDLSWKPQDINTPCSVISPQKDGSLARPKGTQNPRYSDSVQQFRSSRKIKLSLRSQHPLSASSSCPASFLLYQLLLGFIHQLEVKPSPRLTFRNVYARDTWPVLGKKQKSYLRPKFGGMVMDLAFNMVSSGAPQTDVRKL